MATRSLTRGDLVVRLAHHHGDVGVVHDGVTVTAHQSTPDRALAAAPHHDELGVQLSGVLYDFVPHIPPVNLVEMNR